MTDRPSFSIVIPTYQRRDIVCDAVKSLCETDYAGLIDVTVVVDGSKDGTAAALAEIDCPFPLQIIEQPNLGAGRARDRGAVISSGEILLFLDDDMMAAPDMVEQHARMLAAGADAVIGHIPLDPKSPDTFLAESAGKWAIDREERLARGEPLTLFDFLTGQLSVRRSVFEEIGGFDPQFTCFGGYGDEDLDLGTRLVGNYDVRFNRDAVSYQRYVVSPRQYLRQWHQAGQADVLFARKHPDRATELFELHGSRKWTSRLLLRPLSAIPLFPTAVAAVAIWLAENEAAASGRLRRMIARAFRMARDLVYWSGVRKGRKPHSNRILVLCYHAIADLSRDPVLADYGIAEDRFAKQLDALKARGFTFIGPDDAVSILEGRCQAPGKAVLLTFDDCYEELSAVARDILQPRGIRAIAFAVTGMRTGTNEWDQAIGACRLKLLDAEGLRELCRHGVEIGCHSRSHRPLPSLDDRALVDECAAAADDIAALGLPRPRFFAYPHGQHDERSRSAVRSSGYAAAFGLLPAYAHRDSDRYALPRVEILAQDIPWRFWLKTATPGLSALTRWRSIPRRAAIRAVRAIRYPAAHRMGA